MLLPVAATKARPKLTRGLARTLLQAAAAVPVVTLLGPQAAGKRSLARDCFPDHRFLSLADPELLLHASEDPAGFLLSLKEPVIIDLVHLAPQLSTHVQVAVAADPRPGRFILLSSQDLSLLPGSSRPNPQLSRALVLLPPALNEYLGGTGFDPETLRTPLTQATRTALPDRWEFIWRGMYPRELALSGRTTIESPSELVARHVGPLPRVQDPSAFCRFLQATAARTSQILNMSELAAAAGVSQPTAKEWITLLRIHFIVTLIPSHEKSYGKRLRNRPRMHFLDTGLACRLLGIPDAVALVRHPQHESLFKSHVVSEFLKAFTQKGEEAPLRHWRDATGRAVELIIEGSEGPVPLAMIAGEHVPTRELEELEWWMGLRANTATRGLIVYGGVESRSLGSTNLLPWTLD